MKEPTVDQYLKAARKMGASADSLSDAIKSAKRKADAPKQSRRERYQSALEKQKPKGKLHAREWKVQSAKGGAFCLVHRESGEFYADYVTNVATSWGAKRFVTVEDAYAYLDNDKFFEQPARKPDRTRKTRAEKMLERYRKQKGYA